MTLAKNLFVKLSFHAKMHKLLNYGHEYTPSEKTFHEMIAQKELAARLERQINTINERIDKKELSRKDNPELQTLKDLAQELREEFAAMKKE